MVASTSAGLTWRSQEDIAREWLQRHLTPIAIDRLALQQYLTDMSLGRCQGQPCQYLESYQIEAQETLTHLIKDEARAAWLELMVTLMQNSKRILGSADVSELALLLAQGTHV